jgi:hypothetical protein
MPGWVELMAHERMRWGYMTVPQLLTRLKRIRKRQKLECFITLAEEQNRITLMEAAYERAVELGYDDLIRGLPNPRNQQDAWRSNERVLPKVPAQWSKEEQEKKAKKGVRVIRFKRRS